MAIVAGNDILASDFISTSAGAGDSGKVPKLNASGKLDLTFLNQTDVQIFTTEATSVGDNTTRFDITNPSGSTFRYTYDGTGTNPSISAANFPVGALVEIKSNQFSGGNQGMFVVTGSGANYFEVSNSLGVAENDKIIDTDGFICVQNLDWTKPTGCKVVEVICIGAGGGGGYGGTRISGQQVSGGAGGGGGAFSRKIYQASNLGSTEKIMVGKGFTTTTYGRTGGSSFFGLHQVAYGGGGGDGGGAGSACTGGSGGGTGGRGIFSSSSNTLGGLPALTAGIDGISGQGAGGITTSSKCAEYGGASGAASRRTYGGAYKGGSSIFGGAGGGGGGGMQGQTSPNPITGENGESGGKFGKFEIGGGGAGGATGATGTAGSAGTSRSGYGCGDGGGGGGASTNNSTGSVGGAGGVPGGGGGGGGAGALQSTGAGTGGVGGTGGRGEIRVISYY